MARPSSLAALAAAALLGAAACVVPSRERQLLQAFFAACQAYDQVVLARLATAPCNPRTDGVVEQFDIVGRTGDDVLLQARVRRPGAAALDQRLRVTLAMREGELIVAGITRPPASQTSPAASSAPPN